MGHGVNATDERAITAKADKRNRLQQRFWLDTTQAEDESLLWYIEDQKAARSWQKTVKTALRLYWSLQQGRADWLVVLFPNIYQMLIDHKRKQDDELNG